MRKQISKSVRFEVFKRDSFKCQYCGRSAPDVLLHVDHIEPVSKGGENEITNLITACRDCNLGKRDRQLDDQSVLAKQKAQLDELNERREQLEMMMQWSSGLRELKESALEHLEEHWTDITGGYTLNDTGLDALRKLVRKHPIHVIVEAMDIARDSYMKRGADSQFTSESVNHAFRKVPGIITVRSLPESEGRLFYIRGILRKRMYCNEAEAMRLLKEGVRAGLTVSDLQDLAKEARNWTDWRQAMERIIAEREEEK